MPSLTRKQPIPKGDTMTAVPDYTLSAPADSRLLDMATLIVLVRGGFLALFAHPFGRASESRAASSYAEGFIDALDRIGFQGMGNAFAIRCAFIDIRDRFASTMADARSPRERERIQERAIDAVINRLLSNTTEDFPHGMTEDHQHPSGHGYAILPTD